MEYNHIGYNYCIEYYTLMMTHMSSHAAIYLFSLGNMSVSMEKLSVRSSVDDNYCCSFLCNHNYVRQSIRLFTLACITRVTALYS